MTLHSLNVLLLWTGRIKVWRSHLIDICNHAMQVVVVVFPPSVCLDQSHAVLHAKRDSGKNVAFEFWHGNKNVDISDDAGII